MTCSRLSRVGIAVSVLLSLLPGGACTNSDVLSSDPGEVISSLVVSPAGAGRYEVGSGRLVQMIVRVEGTCRHHPSTVCTTDADCANAGVGACRDHPSTPCATTADCTGAGFAGPCDGGCDPAGGLDPLALLPGSVSYNLNDGSEIPISTIPLNAGVYQIQSIVLEYPEFIDRDLPDPPVTCFDGALAGLDPPGNLEATSSVVASPPATTFEVSGFDPPLRFQIDRDGSRVLRVTVDGPRLTATFESAFTCRSSGTCATTPSRPAPCFSAFAAFTADTILCPGGPPCDPLITIE